MSHMPAQVPIHITFSGFLPPNVASLLPQPTGSVYVLSMPAYVRKRRSLQVLKPMFKGKKTVEMDIIASSYCILVFQEFIMSIVYSE